MEQIAQIADLPGILRRLNKLPKTAQQEVREIAKSIAADEAERIRAKASASSKQAAAISQFIVARRDRVPSIQAGGKAQARVAGGATRGEVFFGAEFGGQKRKTTMQFRPHKGKEGYFFYPTLREDADRMVERWLGAIKAIEREWGQGV